MIQVHINSLNTNHIKIIKNIKKLTKMVKKILIEKKQNNLFIKNGKINKLKQKHYVEDYIAKNSVLKTCTNFKKLCIIHNIDTKNNPLINRKTHQKQCKYNNIIFFTIIYYFILFFSFNR